MKYRPLNYDNYKYLANAPVRNGFNKLTNGIQILIPDRKLSFSSPALRT